MIIEYLKIKKFRSFQEDTIIPLSENITVIAGQNGTSKSTILGMLAQPFQFKQILTNENLSKEDKNKLSSFLGMKPQTKFSEIFNLSPKNDLPTDDNIYEYTIKINDKIQYPQTQEAIKKYGKTTEIVTKTSPSRLSPLKEKYGSINNIPEKELTKPSLLRFVTGDKHESGFGQIDNIPVIYLGLSRLYPLAEMGNIASFEKDNANITIDEERILERDHDNILMVSHENSGKSKISQIDLKVKKNIKNNIFAYENDIYDGWANSMGEDSLLNILKSIIYFKRIKEILKRNNLPYYGGLLLIDELDASLYPAAQKKLYDKLLHYSKKYNIQIIFTTHSETLLKYIYKKHNGKNIIFLRKEDHNVVLKEITSYETMESYLTLEYDNKKEEKKVIIFREDEQTENFLKSILKFSIYKKLKFITGSLNCSQITDLSKSLSGNNFPAIFIVDGDTKEDINKSLIKLPGEKSPEELLIKYMLNEYKNTEIEEKLGIDFQKYFGDFYFNDEMNQNQKTTICKDKFKELCEDKIFGKRPYSKAFNLWINKHQEEVETFKRTFIKLYNKEAEKIGKKPIIIEDTPIALEEVAATKK